MESQDTAPKNKRSSIGSRRNPESEAAVLDAARQLLIEKGYAGFSIEEVAKRASAGKPTIYRWWPTKADLLISAYAAEKAANVPLPDSGNLARDLTEYTSSLWSFWRTNAAASALQGLIAEAQSSPPALEALRDRFLPDRVEPARAMFHRAVARGELPSEGVEARLELWVGFIWFRLLTGQIDADGDVVSKAMEAIAK